MVAKTRVLQTVLKNIPFDPGVYKMLNDKEEVIYVGKAKNLKKRVLTYFSSGAKHSAWTKKLIEDIVDIQYIVVNTELEALILEVNLIKALQPKYNILMKDGKNFSYVKITLNEDFPRITFVRKVFKDNAKYFGPMMSVEKVRSILDGLRKLFPMRNCNLEMEEVNGEVKVTKKTIAYPCLEYHIKRCDAPCIGNVNKEQYANSIRQIVNFLSGRTDEIVISLKGRMHEAVKVKNFELAARLRDELLSIENISHKQVINVPKDTNQDVIAQFTAKDKAYFNFFMVREGKLIDQKNFILNIFEGMEESDVLDSFIKFYYQKAVDFPEEILIGFELDENQVLEEWISNLKGGRVKIIAPKRGGKNQLLELAFKNAESYAKQHQIKWMQEERKVKQRVDSLKKVLDLKSELNRIECYDISHLAGEDTVGSMVVFEKGKSKPFDYRHFKLKTTQGKIDDVKSMSEVLTRRFSYLKKNEPDQVLKEFKIRKARLKEADYINEVVEKEKLDGSDFKVKDFFVVELPKDKKIIGFGRIKTVEDLQKISSLWIDSDYRSRGLGGFLLKYLLSKTKTRRIYVTCKLKYKNFYEKNGFKQIYQIPEILFPKVCESCETAHFVYEKIKADQSFAKMPDLVVVDGGRGQLNAGIEALKNFNFDIPIVSLAKREEEIFLSDKKDSIVLEKSDPALHLLQLIRDEAHRFAITYNRNLRLKKLQMSALDYIDGIGKSKKSALLRKFGSVEEIKNLSLEDLSVEVGEKLAKKLKGM